MITERELLKEIELCEKDPMTSSKGEKLAHLCTIYDHYYGNKYSYAPAPIYNDSQIIDIEGDSEFLKAVDGKDINKVLLIMDELMDKTYRLINKRLYDAVMRKIKDA